MKKIVLLITTLFVSAAGVFSQATEPVKVEDNPNAPEITFDKLVHDYGTVAYGGDGVCTFKFTNTGKEPLILQQPQSSCGCTVPTWPKEPVLPGNSSEIQVTYNTKKVGPINKTITVRSNAKNNTIVLRIQGTVQADPTQQLPEKTTGEGTPVSTPVPK
jgi:hypothetical protein